MKQKGALSKGRLFVSANSVAKDNKMVNGKGEA
jgi:hypothetical protein